MAKEEERKFLRGLFRYHLIRDPEAGEDDKKWFVVDLDEGTILASFYKKSVAEDLMNHYEKMEGAKVDG